MNSQEFQCPICKNQYTQSNPPRLLTMCGHTFCHKCIKSLITKKKDNKYKIKCHIDKIVTQILNPSPTYFPKNIILLQALIKSKLKTNSMISYEDEKNQFLSVGLIQTSNIASRKSIALGEKSINMSKVNAKQNDKSNDFCLKHNKNLQVLCCVDLQKICTDCALFGKHKGHKFKNIDQVSKQQKIITKQLTEIIIKKKHIQTKIKNDQIQKEIVQLLENKKTLLKDRIQFHFQEIYKFIKSKQLQAHQNLNNVINKAQKLIQQKLSIEQKLENSYKSWESQAENTIMSLQSQTRDQNLVKFVTKNGYKQLVNSGQTLLSQIQKQQDMLIYQVEHQIQSMKFQPTYHKQKLQELIKVKDTYQIKFSQKLQSQENNQKQQMQLQLKIQQKKKKENDKYQYVNEGFCHEEESLLDGQYDSFKMQRSLKHSSSLNSIQLSLKFNSILTPLKSPKKSKYLETDKNVRRSKNPSIALVQSSKRPRTLTSCYSSSVLLQNNSIIKNKSIASKTNITELPLKYLKGIQKVKNGVSDTLDLSGAQLGDQKIEQFFNNLKKFNHIKHIKLVKNKLTDAALLSILTCFPLIQKLNLAQNKFTQKALQQILEFQKERKIQLNCLNLAQNKIIQRKQKQTLQQLKNQNVTVSL